jgi:DivIVA domain-containing protein
VTSRTTDSPSSTVPASMVTADAFESEQPGTADEARRPLVVERQFTVTPIELRQAKFASAALGGYNKAEVHSFLAEASESFDLAVRENERLRQEISRLDGSLKQYRSLENSLNAALLNAQKVADDVRSTATQEATRLVAEAEGRAALIVESARARIEDTELEVEALHLRRREAVGSLESLIAALSSTLEFVRDPQREPRRTEQRSSVDEEIDQLAV